MAEMWFYLLVALLPVAAYSGFRFGRKSAERKLHRQTAGLSRQYFDGLNYLLDEQPDRAIDTFVKMLEVDSETAETYLALGNMYRKRGEVDLAIRSHQVLIARPSLDSKTRKKALLELGLDYMAAGLFDRAESIFKDLIQESRHKATSLRQLMQIYQQTKDWSNAVTVAEQLQTVDNKDHAAEIANFYCELAQQQVSQNHVKAAFQSLKRAINIDSKCVRANMIRGELSIQEGQYKQALKYYRELVKFNPEFVSEVLEAIKSCYEKLNDLKGYKSFLRNTLPYSVSVSVVLAYADLLREEEGEAKAAQFISDQLEQKPSLKGLLSLIDIQMSQIGSAARSSLEVLHRIIQRSFDSKPTYRCSHCGFSGKTLFWQCPSCKYWGAVKPIVGLEGE
ncbi:lipopolysaccharide assembly protein LapB [Pleionea sediminis]|uniref:lipopolysaccharide assembly protein LapB n=1 Tax=Pleionea sediminis TaxID=2569479 RepID=UPI00118581EE|nr:lipopolysaccharide assembly protein LapB [Pleionea sediminis]